MLPCFVYGKTDYDTIRCKRNPEITYSVYLPEGWSRDIMVYLLDPAGRSGISIERFKSAADRFRLMIVCSENSVNGPIGDNLNIFNEVMIDVRERFSQDSSWVILSGFSGGARAAIGIADRSGERIAGVIACGAGPPRDYRIPRNAGYPYAGITGTYDMNFYEMIEMNSYLDRLPNANTILFFEGGHQWPTDNLILLSITWLMQVLHHDGVTLHELCTLIQQSMEKGRDQFETWLKAYELKEIIQYFKDDKQDTSFVKMLNELSSGKNYEKDLKSFEYYRNVIEEERNIMVEELGNIGYSYLDEPDLRSIEWWKSKVQFINGLSGSRDIVKRNAGLRLRDFLWRNCSEQGYIHYDRGHYNVVIKYDNIWKLVQPESYIPWIRSALCFKEMKDNPNTLSNLKTGVKKGFSNRPYLTEHFSDLSGEKQFGKILEELTD